MDSVTASAWPEMEQISLSVLARMKADKLRPLSVVGTPWPVWNQVCRGSGGGEGLAHGWHVVVGASSGAGKSLTATNMAATAVRAGEHVSLISLEMSQGEVTTRLMAIISGEDVRTLEHGRQFLPNAWDRAADLLAECSGSIRINRRPINKLSDIVTAMHQGVDEGCRTFIVDYLQLAWVVGAESLLAQITEVSHTVNLFAKDNRVLTIGLSQVNRQTSANGGELRKEGLMGGSSLENDADQVLLLGKPEPNGKTYRSNVILDKNRHGPPAKWNIVLDPRTLRMREMMPDEEPSKEAKP